MCKLKELFLMLCLILSGAFCYASGMAGTENGKESDGVPIDLKESTGLSGLDKSNSIIATLNDNVLIVVFRDLGKHIINNTFGDAVFVMVRSDELPSSKE